jgi:uncharacterized membrane protein YqaE (UPF0057 family)
VRRAVQLEQEIEAERVGHLVRQAPTGFIIGTLTVAAVVVVLWNAVPRHVLLAWVGAMGVLSLPAFVVVSRFTSAARAPSAIAAWRRALIAAYGLAGAGWGALPLLLYARLDHTYQLFLLFVIGSAGVGGMVALAPVRSAFIAYMLATFLPTIGVLLAGGSVSSVVMGLLLATFGMATVVLASELRALLVRSVKLRHQNVALIDDLSRAKDAAEARAARSRSSSRT